MKEEGERERGCSLCHCRLSETPDKTEERSEKESESGGAARALSEVPSDELHESSLERQRADVAENFAKLEELAVGVGDCRMLFKTQNKNKQRNSVHSVLEESKKEAAEKELEQMTQAECKARCQSAVVSAAVLQCCSAAALQRCSAARSDIRSSRSWRGCAARRRPPPALGGSGLRVGRVAREVDAAKKETELQLGKAAGSGSEDGSQLEPGPEPARSPRSPPAACARSPSP